MHTTNDASPLTETDEDRRFGGLARIYGVTNAERIRAAHVMVVGIGGVGSWAAEALARSGVGALTLIDMDHIAESNVNRQIHALSSTLGQSKIDAMKDRIGQINPACEVNAIDDFVTPENWASIAALCPDAVIDACDDSRAKLTMAVWGLGRGGAMVTVGAAGGKRLAHGVDVVDLADVTHDPLLAQLRQKLRKLHGAAKPGQKIGVRCVYSPESVQGPDESCRLPNTDGSLNCHGYGSLVGVTATFGFCAANEVLNFLVSPLRPPKNDARI